MMSQNTSYGTTCILLLLVVMVLPGGVVGEDLPPNGLLESKETSWVSVTYIYHDDGGHSLLVDGTEYVPVSLQDYSNSVASDHQNTVKELQEEEKPCKEEGKIPPSSTKFIVYVGICVGLVLAAGILSGLTVGLFSVDPLKLQLIQEDPLSDPEDKKNAAKIAPLIENHHLLLVTLLIGNASAMEALPLFLDELVPTYAAILLSVSFVLIFGEILPQAICTSNPLKIGARFSFIIRGLMILIYPLAWPISKCLDCVLGEHGGSHFLFKRSELTTLIDIHSQEKGGTLEIDEVTIMQGALRLKSMTVLQCLTALESVFMLEKEAILTRDVMADIMASGHSRIPVYHGCRSNIIGLVLVKRLIPLNIDDYERKVGEFCVRKPLVVPPFRHMYDMLNEFQRGKSHLALVTDHVEEVCTNMENPLARPVTPKIYGIITLEDVIEELIQEEISDEQDFAQVVVRSAQKNEKSRRFMVNKAVSKFKKLVTQNQNRQPPVYLRAQSSPGDCASPRITTVFGTPRLSSSSTRIYDSNRNLNSRYQRSIGSITDFHSNGSYYQLMHAADDEDTPTTPFLYRPSSQPY